MLEIDEASLAKESKARKSQIDSMVEEEKREELVSEDLDVYSPVACLLCSIANPVFIR